MNYVSAVYGIILLILFLDWFVRGRKHYRGASKRHEEMDGLVRDVAEKSPPHIKSES